MILNILSDTGTVSLILYGFFIALTITAFIISIKIIKNDKIEKERFDKIVELFKFSIVTVSIATVTLIITDLFKEREYDKEEMTTFNTYIPQIIDSVSTLDRKITFCTFFSHVTPKGDLKNGWISFTRYLEKEREKLKEKSEIAIKQSIAIEKKDSLKLEDFSEMASQVKETQQIYENTNTESDNSSFLVVVGTDPSQESAKPELKWAQDSISSTAQIYKKGKWFITAIPVSTGYKDAKNISETIKTISEGKRASYIVSSKNIKT
jgi:hypothetical protein